MVRKGNWTTLQIKHMAGYNKEIFYKDENDRKLPESRVIDLTSRQLFRGPPQQLNSAVETAKTFTLLAIAVPFGELILGCGFWWVLMGFRGGAVP